MKEINYVEYKHSYAHALAGKTDAGKSVMTAIRLAACQKKDARFVYNLVSKYVFKNPDVVYTDKEIEFQSEIKNICLVENNPIGAYYRCKNAVDVAKEIIVLVDDSGRLVD